MIRPRHDRVLVAPLDDEPLSQKLEIVQFDRFNVKSSGIESKSWTRGNVLALGPDCDHKHGVQIGDVIRFTKNGGLPVTLENNDYLLLSEKDIIGVEEHADGPRAH